MAYPRRPLADRLAEGFKIDHKTGCWVWQKGKSLKGYGVIGEGGGRKQRQLLAHRAMYAQYIGAIPDHLVIDHLCRNRACVNPWHLEPVTHRENILRGEGQAAKNAVLTHCQRGHRFTSGNTYVQSRGQRGCLICRRERDKTWKRNNRELLKQGVYAYGG